MIGGEKFPRFDPGGKMIHGKPGIPVLLAGFIISLILGPVFAAQTNQQGKDKNEPKAAEKIFIPKEVKAVLEQGMAARQSRLDIPFTIFKHIYLPARDSVHAIFLFKAKNADLGFAPPAGMPAPTQPVQLQAQFYVFLQFLRVEKDAPAKVVQEAYVPATIQAGAEPYDPEKEAWYSIAYTLLPGDYLLAMAITSPDLNKIGTTYFDFSLPDAKASTQILDTTPVFFIKQMNKMEAPEMKAQVHPGFFTYSLLRIEPNIDNIFKAGDNLDIFFYVFGAKPGEARAGEQQAQYNIEVNYEVKQGDKPAIRYEPAIYFFPLISHALPMKQTVLIKTEKEQKREQRDLPAGKYTLSLKISDKNSDLTVEKTVDFEVK
jgi:hypothetical protein